MKSFKIAIFLGSLLVAVVFINQSCYLRGLAYETIPEPYVADEYNYIWQAVSLKKSGLPIAWSVFKGVYSDQKYQAKKGELQGFNIYVDKKMVSLQDFKKNSKPITIVTEVDWGKGLEHMTYVAPFFDHSPLGGLIYSLGVSKNISRFDQVKPADFRRPALVMAIITAMLLFIFILQITGKPLVAALSCAIYSTVPTYIFATRGAYLENVAPPFILGHLILLLVAVNLLTTRRFRLVYPLIFLSGLLGGLGGLSKETSLGFLVGSLIIVLIKKIPIKYVLTFAAGIVFPIMIYIGWGLWLQKNVFIAVILANAVRGDFGSLKLLTTLESLRFRGFPIDGWWIWGIVSVFIVGCLNDLKKNNYMYLILPVLFGLLAIIFSANSNYPWYWLSLIPFLAGASGIIIGYLFEYPNFILLMTFFLLPFSSSFYWGYSVFHQNSGQNLNVYRASFIIIMTGFVFKKFFVRYKYSRYIWIIIFAVILYETSKWNFRSIQFLVANWNNLPVPSIPEL